VLLSNGAGVTYNAFCVDGWVLLAKLNGANPTWNWDSTLWTDDTITLNTGVQNLNITETKQQAFNYFPFSSLRLGFCMFGILGCTAATDIRWVTLSFPAATYPTPLVQVMRSGQPLSSNAGRGAWQSLTGTPPAIVQIGCSVEGIMPVAPNARIAARIGLVGNDVYGWGNANIPTCATPDSVVGFGIRGGGDCRSSFYIPRCSRWPGPPPTIGNWATCMVMGEEANSPFVGYILAQ
jgi:hypothetical protein